MSFFVFYILATALILAQCEGILHEGSDAPHAYTDVADCSAHRSELRNNRMKALIRPRETLVTLKPGPGYNFSPSLVSVNRCDGFCPDRWSPSPTSITNKQFIVQLYEDGNPSPLKCVAVEVEEHRSCKYLRCKNSTVCQGTAKIVNNAIEDLNPHSEYCLPDDVAEFKARFREALKEALARHWYRLRDLYDSLQAVHPEAAEHMSFRSIRSYMKRCRKNLYPPHPDTIQEFAERLNDPDYARNLEYNSGRLSVQLVTDETGNKHTLFYDENFVQTEMREVTKVFIDGTFRSTPSIQDAYQLVTIMGIKFDHGIPFVWVVMSRKTQIAYTAVLKCIRDDVMRNNNIRLAMSDFERALRNAIVEVFPRAHSTGCNTHHDRVSVELSNIHQLLDVTVTGAQGGSRKSIGINEVGWTSSFDALYQKAKALGLQNTLRDDATAKKFFKNIVALAYLPANLIQGQYSRLKNELPANIRRRFSRFLDYYNRYWLQTVTPHGYSVFGLSRRTNNVLESYNSRLGHKLEIHPAPWDFVCKLLKLQSDAKADVQRLRNNCPIGRHARYATIYKQKQLVKAWRELHMQYITVEEFVEKAASLKGDVSYLIARETNGREGAEFELADAPLAIRLEDDPDYDRELFANDPPHWLIDNAEIAQLAPANDGPGNQDDTSDSSGDEADQDQFPDAIVEAQVTAMNIVPMENRHPRTPPPEPEEIELDMDVIQDADVTLETIGGQSPPPEPIELDMDAIQDVDAALEENADRQSPPPEPIEQDMGAIGEADVLHPIRDRQSPVPEPIGHRHRHRRARRRPVASASVAAPEAGSSAQQYRNRRRKELRQRAHARQLAQLAEAQEQVQRQAALAEAAQAEANRLRVLAEENAASAMCRVCLLESITHTFLPCGHRCCCVACATRIWDTAEDDRRRCPLCRTLLTQAPVRIWLSS